MFSLINCKSNKSAIDIKNAPDKQIVNLENCTIGSQCSIEIMSNSNLLIKKDKQKNAYIEFEEGDKTIIKYEFIKDEPPNTADAHYSELIYFEIDKNSKHLFLTNEALQSVKMIYGRFCYCKDGTSGYFKVNTGQLKLIRTTDKLSIDLKFKVGKIPQLITEINETITFK